jgi:ribosomal protein L7/L12
MIPAYKLLVLLICLIGCSQQPAPPPFSPDANTEVREASLEQRVDALLDEGRKIETIRVYRAETGVGLKEAKDAVDALEHERQSPQAK